MQARSNASEGDSSLLSALGLSLGDGSRDLVDLMDDGLMATLGARPPAPALPVGRDRGRWAAKRFPCQRALRA